MSGWRCGIGDCEQGFGDVESLIIHQTTEHDKHECQVCGTLIGLKNYRSSLSARGIAARMV